MAQHVVLGRAEAVETPFSSMPRPESPNPPTRSPREGRGSPASPIGNAAGLGRALDDLSPSDRKALTTGRLQQAHRRPATSHSSRRPHYFCGLPARAIARAWPVQHRRPSSAQPALRGGGGPRPGGGGGNASGSDRSSSSPRAFLTDWEPSDVTTVFAEESKDLTGLREARKTRQDAARWKERDEAWRSARDAFQQQKQERYLARRERLRARVAEREREARARIAARRRALRESFRTAGRARTARTTKCRAKVESEHRRKKASLRYKVARRHSRTRRAEKLVAGMSRREQLSMVKDLYTGAAKQAGGGKHGGIRAGVLVSVAHSQRLWLWLVGCVKATRVMAAAVEGGRALERAREEARKLKFARLQDKRRASTPFMSNRVWLLLLKQRVKRRVRAQEKVTAFMRECFALHDSPLNAAFAKTIRRMADTIHACQRFARDFLACARARRLALRRAWDRAAAQLARQKREERAHALKAHQEAMRRKKARAAADAEASQRASRLEARRQAEIERKRAEKKKHMNRKLRPVRRRRSCVSPTELARSSALQHLQRLIAR